MAGRGKETETKGSGESEGAKVHVLPVSASDRDLLERLRRGDSNAVAQLYDRFQKDVNRLVYRMLGPDPEHDDLVQQVFYQVTRGAHRIKEDSKLKSWVLGVTVNIVRSDLRKRTVRRRFMVRGKDPDTFTEAGRDDEARALLSATFAVLERLPAKERVAFSLRRIDGRTLQETAELCGCSLATAKRLVRKAEDRFSLLAQNHPKLKARLEQAS